MATGLIDPNTISLETIVIAMAAALTWTLVAWWRGIPSSSSHALIGGLPGAALLTHGPEAILAGGLVKVVLPLFLAPPLGLVLAGHLDSFRVPFGVMAACAASIALGTSRGDWRLIRTLGGKIYRIRPLNALASQTASSGVIMASALLGAPVSTSQVIGMALMGAGAAERVNKVRWQVGHEMLMTWVLTIPATAGIAALVYWVESGVSQANKLVNWLIMWLAPG